MNLLLAIFLPALLNHQSYLMLGGSFRQAAVDDSLLYVAEGRGISVFTQSRFQRLGSWFIPGEITHVIKYKSLIIAGGQEGLVSFSDSSDFAVSPSHLIQMEWISRQKIAAMAEDNGKLWFVGEDSCLYSFNLDSDTTAEKFKLKFSFLPVKIIIHDNKLYMPADADGLFSIDLTSDLSKTTAVRHISIQGNPPVLDLLFTKNMVYVAAAEKGLIVATLKRNRLKVKFNLELDGELSGLQAFGDRIAVAAGTSDYFVLSITNPKRPELIKQERMPGIGISLVKSRDGKSCFLMTGGGMAKLTPALAPQAGRGLSFRILATGYDILAKSDIATIAAGDAGLKVIKVDSNRLYLIGAYTNDIADARRLYMWGSQVYALTTANMLNVADLKDPAHPLKRTFLQFKSLTRGIDAIGEMLLAAEDERGVGVYWRCPCGPFKEQGRYNFAGRALDVVLKKRLAFVSATGAKKLLILDWSDSTNVEEVGSLEAKPDFEKLFLDGDRLYGLDEDGELAVFNLRRPTRPKLEAEIKLEGNPNDLVRYKNTLFVSAAEAGIHEIDISSGKPVLTRTYAGFNARGVAVSNGLLLVSTPYSVELFIIE